jgi:tight adherence protein C
MTLAPIAGAGAAALTGLVLGRRAPHPGRRSGPHERRLDRAGGDRRAAAAFAVVVIASAVLVFGPAAGIVGLGLLVAGPRCMRRRSAARRRAAVAGAVPDLVDLFLVAASAGHPVAGSLAVVGPRSPPAVRLPVLAAGERFRRGLPLAECLAGLGDDLAPAGTALAEALQQAAASGVPVVPLLEGVAATARDERRRRAQEAARRLPVTMLFPLVLCILPAAVLLAVVPVLVVSVGSLAP